MPTVNEIQQQLQNLTNSKVSYTDIGNVLGTGRSNISLRAKNKSQLTINEIQKLESAYKVNLIKQKINNSNDNTVTLDYFPDVFGSCGNGVFPFSTKKELITIPKTSLYRNMTPGKQYFVINAYGNSMEPYICDKDQLVVESYEGEQIIDNRPYLFCYKDEIFIKRLAKNVDQLMIIPENKDYDVRKLTGKELEDVNIIGEIVGLMRNLRM